MFLYNFSKRKLLIRNKKYNNNIFENKNYISKQYKINVSVTVNSSIAISINYIFFFNVINRTKIKIHRFALKKKKKKSSLSKRN